LQRRPAVKWHSKNFTLNGLIMAKIAAYEDVKATRKQREVKGGHAWRTEFFQPPPGDRSEPHAFLAERCYNGGIRPHFHDVDQFQVIVSGGGTLGRHALPRHTVHFARAHTPYGPIVPTQEGLGFLTLRARRAAGQFIVPDKIDLLTSVADRRPWQVSEAPVFGSSGEICVRPLSSIRDEHGLAASSMRLKPNAKTTAPDPSGGAGQYLIVTAGSLVHGGRDHHAITLVFVKPDEAPFQLVAGAQGLDVLALNFPRENAATQTVATPPVRGGAQFRVWQCLLCAFSYDESLGMPDEGIAPGTRWEDVSDSWSCPDCAATKSDFEMVVVA
jgi:rubredoxin